MLIAASKSAFLSSDLPVCEVGFFSLRCKAVPESYRDKGAKAGGWGLDKYFPSGRFSICRRYVIDFAGHLIEVK